MFPRSRLVVSVFALALFLADAAHAQQFAQPRTVSVTGEAERKVEPDQAILSFTVFTESKDLKAAKKTNDEKLAKFLKMLEGKNVPENQIRTLYANISPRYDYANDRQILRGYMVSNTVEATVKNLDSVGAIVDGATNIGVDRMENIRFGLQDSKKIEREVLLEALKDARTKADSMAGALGEKVGRVLMISDGSASLNPPPPIPMMMRAESKGAAFDGNPNYTPTGLVAIHGNVQASFGLE